MDKKQRMKELISILLNASDAYYNKDVEIMSDFEYDMLFDELARLEKETGIVLENSPTQNAGIQTSSNLKELKHEYPALSLDKTKSKDKIVQWLGNHTGCFSWKMDGLTIVATYENGKIKTVGTRGDGHIGEDVTFNAKNFKGLPKTIPYKGKLIVRSEAVMTFKEFERINSEMETDVDSVYKNARNLASATVRLTNAKEAEKREIVSYAFKLVYADDKDKMISTADGLDWLQSLGFNVVEHFKVTAKELPEKFDYFEKNVITNTFPSDGLVLVLDDVAYGNSLGATGHHERSGIAFKWQDKTERTTIRKIEWSASRTGLLNPVAVFDPVELEGTTVTRASVHNVSVLRSLSLSVGAQVDVYKANMIIPQIAKNVVKNGSVVIPEHCPVCGGKTKITNNAGVEMLFCDNPSCPAKKVKSFEHFCSRNAMDIEGLSEATLQKFIEKGFLKSFCDIYHLDDYKNDIITMDGFGEKSYENIMQSITKSKACKFSAALTALGIPGVGKEVAKRISLYLNPTPIKNFFATLSSKDGFSGIEGVGQVINDGIYAWYENVDQNMVSELLTKELNCFPDATASKVHPLIANKFFAITGSLNHFTNREALKENIENHGGHVVSSISAKTDYLINNDSKSTSSKNKKAQSLNIPIITEEEYLTMIEE